MRATPYRYWPHPGFNRSVRALGGHFDVPPQFDAGREFDANREFDGFVLRIG